MTCLSVMNFYYCCCRCRLLLKGTRVLVLHYWLHLFRSDFHTPLVFFIAASDFSIASLSQSSLNLDGSVNQSCLSLPNSSVAAMTTSGASMANSLTAPTVENIASSLLTNVQYSQALPIPLGEDIWYTSIEKKTWTLKSDTLQDLWF